MRYFVSCSDACTQILCSIANSNSKAKDLFISYFKGSFKGYLSKGRKMSLLAIEDKQAWLAQLRLSTVWSLHSFVSNVKRKCTLACLCTMHTDLFV